MFLYFNLGGLLSNLVYLVSNLGCLPANLVLSFGRPGLLKPLGPDSFLFSCGGVCFSTWVVSFPTLGIFFPTLFCSCPNRVVPSSSIHLVSRHLVSERPHTYQPQYCFPVKRKTFEPYFNSLPSRARHHIFFPLCGCAAKTRGAQAIRTGTTWLSHCPALHCENILALCNTRVAAVLTRTCQLQTHQH